MEINLKIRKNQKIGYSSFVPLQTILAKNATFDQSSSMNIEIMDDKSLKITPAWQDRQAMKPEIRYRLKTREASVWRP